MPADLFAKLALRRWSPPLPWPHPRPSDKRLRGSREEQGKGECSEATGNRASETVRARVRARTRLNVACAESAQPSPRCPPSLATCRSLLPALAPRSRSALCSRHSPSQHRPAPIAGAWTSATSSRFEKRARHFRLESWNVSCPWERVEPGGVGLARPGLTGLAPGFARRKGSHPTQEVRAAWRGPDLKCTAQASQSGWPAVARCGPLLNQSTEPASKACQSGRNGVASPRACARTPGKPSRWPAADPGRGELHKGAERSPSLSRPLSHASLPGEKWRSS